jgi:predicted dehydrogenase
MSGGVDRWRAILIGTGGFGEVWCSRFLPSVRDRLTVVAAVDERLEALSNASRYLGVAPDRCYTSAERALQENPADLVVIVVPPAAHGRYVRLALAHDLAILCEKPIAPTLYESVAIARLVRARDAKMGVTMNWRFARGIATLRHELRSGRYGALNYLVMRFTCDARADRSWGEFRHRMSDPLLVEAGVHHLDLLVDLAGSRCESVYAESSSPTWGEYAGDCQAFVLLRCQDGTRILYEAAMANAVGLNAWGNEYVRAECEGATLVLEGERLVSYCRDDGASWQGPHNAEVVPLLRGTHWGHERLIRDFLRWLEGGEALVTNVQANLVSIELVDAAVRSAREGRPLRPAGQEGSPGQSGVAVQRGGWAV